MSFHLLASFLIPHLSSLNTAIENPKPKPKPKAAIIDTTGSFPLPLLAKVLKSRILEDRSVDGVNDDRRGGNALEEAVQLCLEMVTISRVFDVEGLLEVLDEIERGNQPNGVYEATSQEQPGRSLEISDSQDESLSPAATSPRRTTPSTGEGSIEVIIVDNMTQIINELFPRREKSNVYTLLDSLSLALHTLSRKQNILTLLHNSAVDINSYHPQHQKPQANKNPLPPPPTPSVFRSNPRKPALGKLFEQFPQLHIFISALPMRRRDAEILYGGEKDEEDVRLCWVIEVLKDECPKLNLLGMGNKKATGRGDEFGGREGMWMPVDIAGGVRFVPAFAEGGGLGA
ncbi:uncharacterized protein BP5553_01056 [Venustampulla echinocandica]|uniref:DNA recombination and repair protein Rad51-like C-terminal domain-containing protein n=1 Tax=Venustampulla echinocandica TaxID=2656787 RepID=A0A370TZZ1_9HELO|nr:uncharacterized protein BP5553_01056 [Venustampulla echinocandica]RDL41077.1 hypothetical protein BP5553_01056 [Venustampulla echinocandica]